MKEISVEKIIEDNGLNIIDIRDNYLYNIGHINNSINIPMNLLLMNPSNYLDKNETYYLYCSYGNNSKIACDKLTRCGYNVVNIVGGFNEYNLCKHVYRNDK